MYLEITQTRLLGQASGVWGLFAAVLLYVGVSLFTMAPDRKAEEFIGYLKTALKDKGAV